jgi:hypothetical protein
MLEDRDAEPTLLREVAKLSPLSHGPHSLQGPHGGHASGGGDPSEGAIEMSAQFQNSSAAVPPSQSAKLVLYHPAPPSPEHVAYSSGKLKSLYVGGVHELAVIQCICSTQFSHATRSGSLNLAFICG